MVHNIPVRFRLFLTGNVLGKVMKPSSVRCGERIPCPLTTVTKKKKNYINLRILFILYILFTTPSKQVTYLRILRAAEMLAHTSTSSVVCGTAITKHLATCVQLLISSSRLGNQDNDDQGTYQSLFAPP